MFTGIVEEPGRVVRVDTRAGYRRIRIAAHVVLEGTELGDSISVDGACQTVVWRDEHAFDIETLQASLEKTTLGSLRTGSIVNLERAALPSTRLGGHLVQGHVDGKARILSVTQDGQNVFLEIELQRDFAPLVVTGGSVTIDGVSLTVAALTDRSFTINIIPHTWEQTSLRAKRAGDLVNIETDIIGRYVAHMLALREGDGARPQGDGARPHGTRPQGDGARPQGDGARPQGDGARPQGDGARPQGDGARPQGDGARRGGALSMATLQEAGYVDA